MVVVSGGVCLSLAAPAQAGSQTRLLPKATQRALQQAYVGLGGVSQVGEAVGQPTVTDQQCSQGYQSGSKTTVLVAPNCGTHVVTVQDNVWQKLQALPGSTQAVPQPATATAYGELQVFSDSQDGNLAIAQTLAASYVIREPFLSYYLAADHQQQLGAPRGERYDWQGEQRQDFEQGSLVWRAEVGLRRLTSWPSGQLLHAAQYSASTYLVQAGSSVEYQDAAQVQRCLPGQTITELSADAMELSLKQHPVSGPASDCLSAAERRAIDWVLQEMATTPAWSESLKQWWSGLCESFVEMAYGTRYKAATAMAHYRYRLQTGGLHTTGNPPAGAFVFYGGSSTGHVGIALGNGYVISTQGYSGQRLPIWKHRLTGLTNPYLGWARFDGTWPR